MDMSLEDGTKQAVHTPVMVARLLQTLNKSNNTFATLAVSDEYYVQTQLTDGGYIIEKREGGEHAHFSATHVAPRPVQIFKKPWWQFWGEAPQQDFFGLTEVTEAFAAYLSGGPDPSFIKWSLMDPAAL